MKTSKLLVLSSFLIAAPAAHAEAPQPVVKAPRPDQRVVPNPDPFLHAYHKAHAGQVVFAKSPIERKTPPGATVTRFEANDKIFVRVYQADSAENLHAVAGTEKCSDRGGGGYDRQLAAFVGDESVILDYSAIGRRLSATDLSFSFLEGDGDGHLVPLYDGSPMPKEDVEHSLRYNYVNKLLPLLKDGDNQVRFVARYRCDLDNRTEFTAAAATVTIHLTPAARAQMAKAGGAAMAKSVLPAKMDRYMKAAVDPYFSRKYSVAAVSASGKWRIEYHPVNGRPLKRKIDGQAFLRGFDDKQCAWLNVTYEQDAVGGNRYSDEMQAYVPPGDPTPVQCAALPKGSK